jgi:antirestriction protein ArdC
MNTMNKQEAKERKDIYQLVTARVMEQLEHGVVPWVCNWSEKEAPRNLTSRKNYRGINFFLLGLAAFDSRYGVIPI